MSTQHARVTSLAQTTLDLGRKIDAVLHVQEQQGAIQVAHGATLAEHGGVLVQHGDALARIEAMLTKLLEGQAVLHQNDMELKRRLDERK